MPVKSLLVVTRQTGFEPVTSGFVVTTGCLRSSPVVSGNRLTRAFSSLIDTARLPWSTWVVLSPC
jgi:hypothetical protein